MEQMEGVCTSHTLERYIDFLGYRKDIGQLIALSDIGISAGGQEGLGLNIAEEMYSGIPVVVSEDRGHKELVVNGGEWLYLSTDGPRSFINSIVKMGKDEELRKQMGEDAKMKMKEICTGQCIGGDGENVSKIFVIS